MWFGAIGQCKSVRKISRSSLADLERRSVQSCLYDAMEADSEKAMMVSARPLWPVMAGPSYPLPANTPRLPAAKMIARPDGQPGLLDQLAELNGEPNAAASGCFDARNEIAALTRGKVSPGEVTRE
jgi:hypothetical protein